ncbi:hypothetical protein MB02_07230 [Croceicoccus estronivorus]|nr:hypothetical protein MB02_07230 [Croceicoccus estronivorus]
MAAIGRKYDVAERDAQNRTLGKPVVHRRRKTRKLSRSVMTASRSRASASFRPSHAFDVLPDIRG